MKVCPVCKVEFSLLSKNWKRKIHCSKKCQIKDWKNRNTEKVKAHYRAYYLRHRKNHSCRVEDPDTLEEKREASF